MNWPTKKISECIEKIPKKDGIPLKKYQKIGKFPIVDQGQKLIGGYTDDERLVYTNILPVIIFGDHTRAIKFIDFPFAVGADGTKVLKPKNFFDPKFFYFLLLSLNIKSRGYARHFSILKEIEIPLPPVEEQKRIVARVEKMMAKIKEAKQLRLEAKEAAKSLLSAELSRFFEEGKKKGWEVKELGGLIKEITSGFACGKQNEVVNGAVHLRTHNINTEGNLNFDKFVQIPEDLVDKKASNLKIGDVLFNNTNSTELVGKTALVKQDFPYAFSNHLTRIRFQQDIVLPEWVVYIFNEYWRHKFFESICNKWVGQSGINQTALKQIKISMPPIEEQKKIVARLDSLAEKIRQVCELQKSTADDFKTLEQSILHAAFSGKL